MLPAMSGWSTTEVAEFAARQARLKAESAAARRRFSEQARAEAEAFAARLVREFGATRVVLFGSVARGEARPGSDIDLAVAGIAPARFFDAAAAAFADVRCATVDLAPLDALHPHIRARVDTEGVVLVG
jgi:predicted nucleotidyltransferase